MKVKNHSKNKTFLGGAKTFSTIGVVSSTVAIGVSSLAAVVAGPTVLPIVIGVVAAGVGLSAVVSAATLPARVPASCKLGIVTAGLAISSVLGGGAYTTYNGLSAEHKETLSKKFSTSATCARMVKAQANTPEYMYKPTLPQACQPK